MCFNELILSSSEPFRHYVLFTFFAQVIFEFRALREIWQSSSLQSSRRSGFSSRYLQSAQQAFFPQNLSDLNVAVHQTADAVELEKKSWRCPGIKNCWTENHLHPKPDRFHRLPQNELPELAITAFCGRSTEMRLNIIKFQRLRPLIHAILVARTTPAVLVLK
jgi:hypothetical protein